MQHGMIFQLKILQKFKLSGTDLARNIALGIFIAHLKRKQPAMCSYEKMSLNSIFTRKRENLLFYAYLNFVIHLPSKD